MTLSVLLCDDETEQAQRCRESLEALCIDITIKTLVGQELLDQVDILDQRAVQARHGADRPTSRAKKAKPRPWERQCEFDRADVVLIDYDLVGTDDTRSASLTGEGVAYLARCYSDVGVIVAFDQFQSTQTFDLTLHGHLESFADINLTSDLIADRGLWTEEFAAFRPWGWPVLTAEPARYRSLASRVAKELDAPILQAVGLIGPRRLNPVGDALLRDHLDFISHPVKEPEQVTFADFVTSCKMGLRVKDRPWDELAIARIAAARVGKWLEKVVLPGQNILVDAPHLAMRFPSLLKGSKASLETWNKTTSLTPEAEDVGLKQSLTRTTRFQPSEWLSRPAWYWPILSRSTAIKEVRDPWQSEEPSFVFCEDTSRFASPDEVKEFVATLPSDYVRRYVMRLPSVNYEPRARFAL